MLRVHVVMVRVVSAIGNVGRGPASKQQLSSATPIPQRPWFRRLGDRPASEADSENHAPASRCAVIISLKQATVRDCRLGFETRFEGGRLLLSTHGIRFVDRQVQGSDGLLKFRIGDGVSHMLDRTVRESRRRVRPW